MAFCPEDFVVPALIKAPRTSIVVHSCKDELLIVIGDDANMGVCEIDLLLEALR